MAKKFVEPDYDVYKVDEVDLVLERDFYIVGNNKITSSRSAVEIFRQFWNENLINIQEQFSVMLLSQSNKVIGMYQHSKGAINSTIADGELIGAVAVKSLAKGVIVAHNHPSGNLEPSKADIDLTKRLKQALALFQINLVDSLIIVQDKTNYYSLSDSGDFADGGVIVGDDSGKEEYIIKDGSDRYYARGLSDGNVKWNDSQDMAYMFRKSEAESIKSKLESEGYSNLSIQKYDKEWWKKMAKGGKTKDKKYLYKTKVRGAFGEYYIVVNAYNEEDALERTHHWVAQERGKLLGKPIKTNEKFVDGLRMVENQYWRVFESGGMMEKGGITIENLTKEKNDLLTRAEPLIAKKKKLYSNVDIESPMSIDEKKLNAEINDLLSRANEIVFKIRKLKYPNKYMNVGLLDVGKYYKTKSGKQVRYLGKTQDPQVGTFTNKTDGVSKIRYDEIEGKAYLFGRGGYMAKGGKTDSAKRIVGSLTARERMKSKMKKA